MIVSSAMCRRTTGSNSGESRAMSTSACIVNVLTMLLRSFK